MLACNYKCPWWIELFCSQIKILNKTCPYIWQFWLIADFVAQCWLISDFVAQCWLVCDFVAQRWLVSDFVAQCWLVSDFVAQCWLVSDFVAQCWLVSDFVAQCWLVSDFVAQLLACSCRTPHKYVWCGVWSASVKWVVWFNTVLNQRGGTAAHVLVAILR